MSDSFLTETVEKDDAEAFPRFTHPGYVQQATDVVRAETLAVQVSDDSESARRRAELIDQAEARAEQQALARVTMLDLARELEEASKARKDMYMHLLQERKEKEQLRAAAEAAEARLAQAEQATEDAKVAHMQDKLRAGSLSGGILSTAVLWSRRAVHIDSLGGGLTEEERTRDLELQVTVEEEEDDEGGDEATSIGQNSRMQATEASEAWVDAAAAEGCSSRALSSGTAAAAPGTTEEAGAQGGSQAATSGPPLSHSRGSVCAGKVRGSQVEIGEKWKPKKLAQAGKHSRGDGITLRWILIAWQEQVKNTKMQSSQGDESSVRIAALEAELQRVREGLEAKLAAEKAHSRAQETRIEALLEELDKLKRRCDELEKEKLELLQQFCGGEGDENPFEALKRRCAELEQTLAARDAEICSLQQTIKELEAQIVRQREEAEEEKRRLKAQIRELSAELQRQIVFAKHLREVALKAKRDAAGSISPEKMAQLIADLEDMRDRLTWLGSTADFAHQQSSLLRAKLDTNSRRMDLERQFLPLLHKVAGPVGPKHPLIQKKTQTQSMSALDTGGVSKGGSRQDLPGLSRSPGHH